MPIDIDTQKCVAFYAMLDLIDHFHARLERLWEVLRIQIWLGGTRQGITTERIPEFLRRLKTADWESDRASWLPIWSKLGATRDTAGNVPV